MLAVASANAHGESVPVSGDVWRLGMMRASGLEEDLTCMYKKALELKGA